MIDFYNMFLRGRFFFVFPNICFCNEENGQENLCTGSSSGL